MLKVITLPKWTKGELQIPMKPNHPRIFERSRPTAVTHRNKADRIIKSREPRVN